MKSKVKVLVGMSGGVDSSVVAALLKEQGYDCVGVYMNLWADPTVFDLEDKKKFPQNKCCSIGSLMAARSICQRLDIPFYSINFEDVFKENVVDFFLEGFREGETPNPCVRCNKTVKFGVLFKKMEELGCDFLATGHYAKLISKKELMELHRGKDQAKDQTYFLYNLSQERLKKILFPLGDYDKPAVKKLATKFGLKELKNKRESQGVCFYPEKTYFEFLKRYLKPGEDFKEGDIEDISGQKIGTHTGLPFYTVGQRKGIGVGGGAALYVQKADSIRNVLIVGSQEDLLVESVSLREANFLAGTPPDLTEELQAKIRSQGSLTPCHVLQKGKNFQVQFKEPQRAIMAGQSLVLYRGTELVGGGIMMV
ncbi:tRNA 2-thiouridine(34) synthase MnmA [Candidatus Peregrinibacteria bacterium]|nr:MAG: tRNA 2-thiouridine(34) synthase MnmA [Candidatus Peregrinibacteria bacterium]